MFEVEIWNLFVTCFLVIVSSGSRMQKTATMDHIILFVKEPIPGQVKTRLNTVLSAEQSCCLYKAFVEDYLELLKKIKHVRLGIAYQGDIKKVHSWLGQGNYTYIAQSEGDLGLRMERVFHWAFSHGAEHCIILGSDSPTLPLSKVRNANMLLRKKDVVLGPAWDGGFYLIGMRRAFKGIFEAVPWSTDRTFSHVVSQIFKQGHTIALVDPWYDVDNINDLIFLKRHLSAIRHNAASSYKRIWRVLSEIADLIEEL